MYAVAIRRAIHAICSRQFQMSELMRCRGERILLTLLNKAVYLSIFYQIDSIIHCSTAP